MFQGFHLHHGLRLTVVLVHGHATAAGVSSSCFLATLQWLAHGADAEMDVMLVFFLF